MAEGHRERLRARFQSENIDTIPEYTVLEYFIQGVIYRRDTNAIARELIARFGSLAAVVDAPLHELKKVDGVGDTAAMFIKSLPKLYRKYCISKWEAPAKFNSTPEIGRFFCQRLIGYENEVLAAVCMDGNCKYLAYECLMEGGIDSVNFDARTVVEFALKYKASRIVIAHNHPNSACLYSYDDVEATLVLREALMLVGIYLDDHIIVSADEFISLRTEGIFDPHPQEDGKA